MTIKRLIEGLKKGNKESYKELIINYSGRLMTIAKIYSRSTEDAEDVLQDAFILVFKKIKDFKGTEDKLFYGWMKRIIINLCLSRNQKKYRQMESSLDDQIIEAGKDAEVMSTLSHNDIMDKVFELPDGYRQVFALYAIEGYSHKEIAEKLDISVSLSLIHI